MEWTTSPPPPEAFLSRIVWEWQGIKRNIVAQNVPRRTFLFVLVGIWAPVAWFGLFYKAATAEMHDVFTYYTNVTFALQALFNTLLFCCMFENPYRRTLERHLLLIWFWIVFVQVMVVFIMVIWVLDVSPELLLDNMKSLGGDYDDGTVITANTFFHVLPAFVEFLKLIFMAEDIRLFLSLTYGFFVLRKSDSDSRKGRWGSGVSSNRSPSPERDSGDLKSRPRGRHLRYSEATVRRTADLQIAEMEARGFPLDDALRRPPGLLPPQSGSHRRPHHPTFEQSPEDMAEPMDLVYMDIYKKSYFKYATFIYCASCAPFLIYMLLVSLHDRYGVPHALSTYGAVFGLFLLTGLLVLIPIYFLFRILLPSMAALMTESQAVYFMKHDSSTESGTIELPAWVVLDISPT